MKGRKMFTVKQLKVLAKKEKALIKGGADCCYSGGDGGPPPYEPKGQKDKKDEYNTSW